MKILTVVVAITMLMISPIAQSRDTKLMLSIEEAMQSADFQAQLDSKIRFYFGDQKHPEVTKNYGSFSSNKKTNAFNKSDEAACRWVFLSAMKSLQDRVRKEGGNAVINIASYYKKNIVRNSTEFECHAGTFVAGVALTGEVVKLAE